MREDPIISGAWIKAALVVLVGGALGAGAYLLASDVDINLPDIDLNTTAETTLQNTTLEDTTIGTPEAATTAPQPKEPPATTSGAPTPPSIQQLQELNRCIQSAAGDVDQITACFNRFAR